MAKLAHILFPPFSSLNILYWEIPTASLPTGTFGFVRGDSGSISHRGRKEATGKD
ncbi:hypothetical protein FRC08_009436 [Ceratobasidium sp. 394]|nr:hypothetical protein FRC08_009436 [Ceratobasidium sp. 394]